MHDQAGGVITGGLAKTALALILFALVVYDFGAVTVNAMQLDDIAGGALRIGRQTWAQTGRAADVEAAVLRRLEDEQDVRLEELEATADEITLTVSRPSRTLFTHRIGPLEQHTERRATKRASPP